jgi:hypothetical protein
MLAVEFETHAKNGIIEIPEKYRAMVEGELKVIILKKEKKTKMSEKGKITQLKKLLKQIREKNIFQTIDDPVEWQRTIRDEWT